MMFKSGQHTMEERRRFLEHLTGKTLSDSTVRRLLWRLGFSRKKDCWGDGTRRVSAGRLEGDSRREGRRRTEERMR